MLFLVGKMAIVRCNKYSNNWTVFIIEILHMTWKGIYNIFAINILYFKETILQIQ